jgi:predicted YcjX-like family ATPase
MDCLGLASIQATQSGLIEVNGEKIPALRGNRLSDGQPLTVYPGEVPPAAGSGVLAAAGVSV